MYRYFLILLFSTPIIVQAQDNTGIEEESETLFSQLESFSVMGGFMLDFSNVQQDIQVASGGGGAVILNKQLYLGAYGLGFSGVPQANNRELDYKHGGFWLGYIFNPKKLVHFNADLQLGWGNLTYYESDGTQLLKDNVFVINPALVAEMNITSWLRFQTRLGYRINTGLTDSEFTNASFSSPNLMLTVLAGWFD